MSKKMSRDNQELIYWFFDCYGYYEKGIDITWKSSKEKPRLSAYYRYIAKEKLKKLYIQMSGKNVKDYDPFKNLRDKLEKRLMEILDKNYTNQNKVTLITELLMDCITSEFQMLLLKLEGTFSLSLKLFSNKEAVKFTNFLFDYFMQHDIPMWEEMQKLYKEQNEDKYIYAKLKHRKCAVCNRSPVDMEHWQNVANLGGYAHDKGQGVYISLCRHHHAEKHNIGVESFERKYDIRGIKLNEDQVKELKKIYKGHFKAFKEENNGKS